jgi:hypothetical protein
LRGTPINAETRTVAVAPVGLDESGETLGDRLERDDVRENWKQPIKIGFVLRKIEIIHMKDSD